MNVKILGISAFYHDSAAVVVCDGEIIAAAQEERFSRKKHDPSFSVNAVRYVQDECGISIDQLDLIAFYDKPYIKFERLLETYHAFASRGLRSFLYAMSVWIKEKLFMRRIIQTELASFGDIKHVQMIFPEHHLSHAASAFFPSPFDKAAILTVDGVGEWATMSIGKGGNNSITVLKELHFPHSLGLLYSAFAQYCGFRVNSGEYKLMGLAPYGDADAEQTGFFKEKILETLVDVREDGSLFLNMAFFDCATGLSMCNDQKWEKLFGMPRRDPESKLSGGYLNFALAAQQVTEEILFRLVKTARELTGCKHLVMAGGVALNCAANGKLLRAGIFDDIWIQPSAGDALGAALAVWHIYKGAERVPSRPVIPGDKKKGAYLGPEFPEKEILKTIRNYHAACSRYDAFDTLCKKVASILERGDIVGWFQGKMEFGPRALGNRSILGDARKADMQKRLNLKIKYREGFRPFAPSVMEEEVKTFFDLATASPYMLLVAPVLEERRTPLPDGFDQMAMFEKLYHVRSDIPAITHVDYSARVQSVSRSTNRRYWQLLNTFKEKTGYGVLVNTSFNVRGEPIVCTPDDAYRCFMRTDMDYLVLGDHLFKKQEQPLWDSGDNWQEEFELD